ncbi:MAG: T9SS type A sorting domain-containing protein [Ignavibacteriaceae bacterium]|nr:T9SS type A sorting domain-containing protein [Ignavibacteriaceae bacterium]
MKSKLVLVFLFLFFHSLSGENKPDMKNLANLFPKNSHAVQTGISTVTVGSYVLYEEKLQQQWMSGNWISSQKTITTLDTATWTMVATYSFNNPQTGWVNQAKYEFHFKITGTILGFLQLKSYTFSVNDWKLQGQSDYTYDANNFLIRSDQQMDFGAGLMPYAKVTYTNNSIGLPLTETIEQLNFSTFTMENHRKITYMYNLSNQEELQTEIRADWRTNQWVDTLKTSYARNSKLLPTIEMEQAFTNPTTLQNINRYEYTYDGSDSFVLESLYKFWDINATNWSEGQKIIYTYSATNKVLSTLGQQMYQNAWKDNDRTTNFYNVDDNITKELYESYLGSSWENQSQTLYTYNPTDVEDKSVAINNFKLFDNYPNPFNPATIINYELQSGSFVTLKVYDVLGNEIATLVNEYQFEGKYQTLFDAKNISNQPLSSGTYFYRLQTNGETLTKKMILLR